MKFKSQKGVSGIDIIISVMVLTIFVTLIGNLAININLKSKESERQAEAITLAIKEVENIKKQGYISDYNQNLNIVNESDITDTNGFTGYHKTVTIKDYKLVKNDNSIQENILKNVTVEISYKIGNKTQSVELSTYLAK